MAESPAGRDIVRALRRLATRDGDAAIAPDVAAELVRRGLARYCPDARLVLTATGRSALRRRLSGAEDFALQHQEREAAVVEDGRLGRQPVTVNRGESPLARLRAQKGRDGRPLIGEAEFAAGERLRAEFTRAGLTPRITANWGAAVASGRRTGGAGGMPDIAAASLDARRRLERALAAVGPEFAGLLLDFCCFLKGIETIERERAWPVRSAKLVLRLALASLARHYGLAGVAHGPGESPGLRHWGSEDYRPLID